MADEHPATRASNWQPRRMIAGAVTAVGLIVSSGAVSLLLWGNPEPVTASSAAPVIQSGQVAGVLAPGVPAPAAGALSAVAPAHALAAMQAQVPAAPPVRIDVPSIRVSSELTELRLQDDGTLGVPHNPAQAGWWSESVAPGDPGPAIIVGHIDSLHGPAVFYRLSELHPGDLIQIGRADGSNVSYAVDALRQYPKSDFPSDLVYGSTTEPTLRLLTCGGSFDRRSGHYEDNLVVFAHMIDSPKPAPPTAATPAVAQAHPSTPAVRNSNHAR